ncbi:hypothetical protein [Burkholderia ubonensis]|uniref:hypothetical protein n=1 Tax=Burkholderia ubonensis TaxID=101571 RepID=UPI000AD8DB88|nr:hypothetical protein [Burkholderia ubonensis]
MYAKLTALAAGTALVLSNAAHAQESFFQIEAGLGVTSAVKLGDGMYYSKGFSHDTPNGSYGVRAGIVLNAIEARPRAWTPGLRFHLDYYNFGKVRWSSVNPQDSADFSRVGQIGGYNTATLSCNDNNCGTFRRFDSVGSIQAIALTVEPYWNLGNGWQLGLEAGPALYRSMWTSIATTLSDGRFGPAGTRETLSHHPRVQAGVLVGVSVGKGAFSARLNYLNAPVGHSSDDNVPAGIKGEWMLSLNYTW